MSEATDDDGFLLYWRKRFFSDSECWEIQRHSEKYIARATVRKSTGPEIDERHRVCFSCYPGSVATNPVAHLLERFKEYVEAITQLDYSHQEPLQFVRYRPGGFYHWHNDNGTPAQGFAPEHGGLRLWTFMVYLSGCLVGGETEFRNGHVITPEQGRLVGWNNTHPGTNHRGRVVEEGCKDILLLWVREFPYPNKPFKH